MVAIRRTHILLLAASAIAVGACAQPADDLPSVSDLQPNAVDQSMQSEVLISGARFFVEPVSNIETGVVGVNQTFAVTIFAADGTGYELAEVVYVDDTSLRALVPMSLPVGVYGARVQGPYGVGDTTEAALTIYSDLDADMIRDDQDPCVDVDRDGLGRGDYDTSGCEHTDADSDDGDPNVCADIDQDQCDDCSSGFFAPGNDGTDEDVDGFCSAVDCEDSPLNCGAACNPGQTEICDGFDNDCDGGVDDDGLICSAPVTPPIAGFSLSPGAGTVATVFSFDAGSSSDVEDAGASLTYIWDFDGDGNTDANGVTTTHSFATTGTHLVSLRVVDTSGLSAYASGSVIVSDPAASLVVDTAADVVNAGDGVTSLREAIATANGDGVESTISFSGPMTITLTSRLPALDSANPEHLMGGSGVVIEGAGFECLDLRSAMSSAEWLTLQNCDSAIVLAGDGAAAANLDISGSEMGILVSGASTLIGPGVEVHNNLFGIQVSGPGAEIRQCRIYENDDPGTGMGRKAMGIRLGADADNAVVWGNTIYRNEEHGIEVDFAANAVSIWNNTIDANGNDGIKLYDVTSADLRNNLLSNASTHGLHIDTGATFSVFDSQTLFLSPCGGMGCSNGDNATFEDPVYVDYASDDLRIALTSPLVDTGISVPVDLNGDGAGTFHGSAPERGAFETP